MTGRSDALERIIGSSDHFTLRHRMAAERFESDYQDMESGQIGKICANYSDTKPLSLRKGGKSYAQDDVEDQRDAKQRVEAAAKALGPSLAKCVACLCLHNLTLAETARRINISRHMTPGYLLSALDRLADHYGETVPAFRKSQASSGGSK